MLHPILPVYAMLTLHQIRYYLISLLQIISNQHKCMKLLTLLSSSQKNSKEIKSCSHAWTRSNTHFWLIHYWADLILVTVKQQQTYSLPNLWNSVPWSETDSSINYGKLAGLINYLRHKVYLKIMSIVPEACQMFIETGLTDNIIKRMRGLFKPMLF